MQTKMIGTALATFLIAVSLLTTTLIVGADSDDKRNNKQKFEFISAPASSA